MGRVAVIALSLLLGACVERRLHIRTDPPGAHARVNGNDVGATPAVWLFHHYGKVLVEVSLDGYESDRRVVSLKAPWYERPVLDFFSDVVLPKRIVDEHEVAFALEPIHPLTEAEIQAETARLAGAAAAAREGARKTK